MVYFATIDSVRSKLAQPIALGYCNVGQIIEVEMIRGDLTLETELSPMALMQIWYLFPQTLCALIPNQVTDEQAAFTTVASMGFRTSFSKTFFG